MLKSNNTILGDLKTLPEMENNRKCKTSYLNHIDDINDGDDIETSLDQIIVPIGSANFFDKYEVSIQIIDNIGNLSLIHTFPNALLLEDSIFNNNRRQISSKVSQKEEKSTDIWEVLDEIKKENQSETIDNLTTESTTSDEATCQYCHQKGSLVEDQHTGVVVCSQCGLINKEILDHGPEWRQYTNDDSRGEGMNRCGCPSSFFFPKSSQGTIMVGSTNSRLKRKQKWNSMVYKERSLNTVFEYIGKVCSRMGIPKIIEDTAKILYKKISDCKHQSGPNMGKPIIIRGVNRVSIIIACISRACDMNKVPRSLKEFSTHCKLEEKKITRGIKQFDRIMKNADDTQILLDQLDPNTAEDYIRSHCSNPKLKISKSNMEVAVRIANNCCKMKLVSDHNPESVAAGSLLLMSWYCDTKLDKKKIASLFGTSDVTISKIFTKILPYADALVDDEATDYLIKKFRING